MKKRIIEGIEVEAGSGNVFADLGLPDAEKLKVKSGLVVEIVKAIRRLDLTQDEAAQRMGLTQPKVSALLRGDFTNLSERKTGSCCPRLRPEGLNYFWYLPSTATLLAAVWASASA